MLIKLENPVLNVIAEDCGLYISETNADVNSFEIEFFAEQVILDVCELINDASLVTKIRLHFGIDRNEYNN